MSSSDDDQADFESDYEYDSWSDDDEHYPVEEEENVHTSSLFNQEPISCPICCEERVEEGRALALPSCSHSFCVDCFTSYLEAEIGRGNADSVTCPFIMDGDDGDNGEGEGQGDNGIIGRQCSAPVGADVLREIMTRERYDRLMQLKDAAFVRKNADYHHCPSPNCTNVVLCKTIDDGGGGGGGGGARICDCFKCGKTSCLTCGARPFHANKTCDEYREEERRRKLEREMMTARALRMQTSLWGMPSTLMDRSRANEEAKYDFNIEGAGNGEKNDNDGMADHAGDDALANVKRCRRCGNGVELQSGCLKMKCLCGYRFCYQCGSENARCDCTPSHHGFVDNKTGMGDFTGLREAKSHT